MGTEDRIAIPSRSGESSAGRMVRHASTGWRAASPITKKSRPAATKSLGTVLVRTRMKPRRLFMPVSSRWCSELFGGPASQLAGQATLSSSHNWRALGIVG